MGKTALMLLILAVMFSAVPGITLAATMIYYDTGDDGLGTFFANMTLNLAGHFDRDIGTAPIDTYHAGDLDDFDHVFYIGLDWTNILPEAFLADVASNDTPVFWIAQNLWQLSEYMEGPGPFGFVGGDYNEGIGRNRIDYKGRRMIRVDEFSFFEVHISGDPTVFSYINGAVPDNEHPHFLCGGNLCYLSEFSFWFEGADDRMLVLADLLHEFFDTQAPEDHSALVRFYEMVPGMVDITNLREIVAELQAREVPTTMAVIPIFKDVQGWIVDPNTEWHFEDDPDLVALIDDLLDAGSVLVMLGITHQFDDGTTGDSEFVINGWAIPLPYDSEEWARDRVEWGLAEFHEQGWYPRYWETPWHMASHGDYYVFADYFDNTQDSPLIFPVPYDAEPIFGTSFGEPVIQDMPYYSPVGSSHMGLVPANLGCFYPGVPGSDRDDILERAERFTIVRDAVVSLCAYSDVDTAVLLELIDALIDMGYEFTDPDDLTGDGDDDLDDDVDDDADDDTDDDGCVVCEGSDQCEDELGENFICLSGCCVEQGDDDEWFEPGDDDDDDDDAVIIDSGEDESATSGCGC